MYKTVVNVVFFNDFVTVSCYMVHFIALDVYFCKEKNLWHYTSCGDYDVCDKV